MEKKERYIVIASFILCLTVCVSAVWRVEQGKLRERTNKTRYVTSSQVSRLQYVLDTLLLKTQTLEMLIVENRGKISDFDRIAEKLCDNQAIRSLQLAPDGVVQYVYPLKGNENAFVDLFHDPARATEAEAARASGELTLSGPYELYQGGLGLVARRPVYLTGEGGDRKFWGFAIIVLDLPDAFYPARLDMFAKEGFEYKLYRTDPDTGATQMIDQSSEAVLQNPEEISFRVPNGVWTFSVMPKQGWIRRREVSLELSVAVLVTVMVTFIVAFVLQLKRQKEILYRCSVTDALTGASNYSRLIVILRKHIGEGRPCALFFMDLDGFKSVNDTFGHDAGNQVLIESVDRLRECFPDGGVFRNGGDEFCAVAEGELSEEQCEARVRSVVERFRKPFSVGEHSICCGISAGYARYPQEESGMEELIQRADGRMYRMKKKLGV